MFNRGIESLLTSLPSIGEMNQSDVRRLLTRAWIEAVDRRDLGGVEADGQVVGDLRRLATALEVHALLLRERLSNETMRACAFVAAEALDVGAEVRALNPEISLPWLFGNQATYERVEAGLLYLIAGYDANAALVGQSIDLEISAQEVESDVESWTLRAIRDFLTLNPVAAVEAPGLPQEPISLQDRARHEILSRIGRAVRSHLAWLSLRQGFESNGADLVREVITILEQPRNGSSGAAHHRDLYHLALLLLAAIDGTSARALRSVPPPDAPDDFLDYQRRRAQTQPLLWPAAVEYMDRALPGPHVHAVVAVPTGAGKSAVAELAIAQAIRAGWVLYLAPTNALAGQIRRQLGNVIAKLPGVSVREFMGGAEYTELVGESFEYVDERQVLVMTPEKCSLALRQNPEVFSRLALCVVDEAHILGEGGARAVVAELVISEILYRAPQVRLLMLSALLANADDLALWLREATGYDSIAIDTPWRPTRTLRAIAGFDVARIAPIENKAKATLATLPARRKNVQYLAPMTLLAGLQGAWRTSDPTDFAFVDTVMSVSLKYTRSKGRNFSGYLNPATQALAQGLGENNHRVLAFLPRSKHDSFTAARNMRGFRRNEGLALHESVDALLTLADEELGAKSEVRDALMKGIGVHTSAMLQEERRACEIAFERGEARVLFATGTLAQGLNLPATAVVIGGTQIGWDPDATTEEDQARSRIQLLNAIGRAGRASVAPRSMAIVLPNRGVVFQANRSIASSIGDASFLAEEDASTEIRSQLDQLIARALDGTLSLDSMTSSELTAFTFLSYSAEGRSAEGVLRRSWAVQRARAAERVEGLAGTLKQLGGEFLASRSAPDWVALSAHRAGLTLPIAAALYHELRRYLVEEAAPDDVEGWISVMINVLRRLPGDNLSDALSQASFKSTRIEGIWSESISEQDAGWSSLQDTITAWMNGEPLLEVASHCERKATVGKSKRGQQDPLPRVLRIVNDGFGFGLSALAGALGAVVAAGREFDADGPWEMSDRSGRALNLLPIALRLGAGSPSVVAWMRAGVRPRVLAHMLDRLTPAPSDMDDEELRRWAVRSLRDIEGGTLSLVQSDRERRLLAAMNILRDAS